MTEPPATSPITIVSGLPRSGTSLMMQMLAAGGLPLLTDGLRRPDADNPRGYFEFEPVKRTRHDSSWLERAPGHAVKMVHLLLRDLPPACAYRVLFMRRRLEEIIASQQTMLDRLGHQGANLPPARLAAVFEQQLRQTEAWLATQPNFTVLYINHRNCIDDPAATAAAVNAFLGGRFNEPSMAAAVAPALYRHR